MKIIPFGVPLYEKFPAKLSKRLPTMVRDRLSWALLLENVSYQSRDATVPSVASLKLPLRYLDLNPGFDDYEKTLTLRSRRIRSSPH